VTPPDWADVAAGCAVGMAGGAVVGWIVGLLHGAELDDDDEDEEGEMVDRHELGAEVQRLEQQIHDEREALYQQYGRRTVPLAIWSEWTERRNRRLAEVLRLRREIAEDRRRDAAGRDASGRQPLYAAAPLLLEALEAVEWVDGWCPACGATQAGSGEHARDCALRAALDAARGSDAGL